MSDVESGHRAGCPTPQFVRVGLLPLTPASLGQTRPPVECFTSFPFQLGWLRDRQPDAEALPPPSVFLRAMPHERRHPQR